MGLRGRASPAGVMRGPGNCMCTRSPLPVVKAPDHRCETGNAFERAGALGGFPRSDISGRQH